MRLPLIALILVSHLIAFSQTNKTSPQLLWKQQAAAPILGGAAATGNGQLIYGDTAGNLYLVSLAASTQRLLAKLPTGIQSTPLMVKDTVFVYGNNGVLYALNSSNGNIYRELKTGGEKNYDFWDYYRSSPQYANGLLYFGSGDHCLYAIDPGTGKEKWKFRTEGIVHADPVISNDTLFIGSYDGNMYALNAITGNLIWKFKAVGDRYFPLGEIQKGALVTEDAVIFGSRDFNIYSIDKRTGTGLWNRKEQGSWIIATPLLFKGNIYYGTSDSHAFYASSVADGNTLWKVPIPFRSYSTAVQAGGRLFMTCFDGKLYELDPFTGEQRWQFSTMGHQLKGNTIFDPGGHLRKDFKMYGTDAETAEAERKIFDQGAILATPLLCEGVLYFGATDGYFYAIRIY
ncbi:MAG: PQQ-binding-like beta-propeller repeat protein [Chitinophagaceae bacterium]|nr:PQQ-binding-like beta-propeller repeat protein [Chitinophagaceae bacterium]